ncbi:hypothetical protein DFH06DRAFT_1305679, partial [Mycena polygramma]
MKLSTSLALLLSLASAVVSSAVPAQAQSIPSCKAEDRVLVNNRTILAGPRAPHRNQGLFRRRPHHSRLGAQTGVRIVRSRRNQDVHVRHKRRTRPRVRLLSTRTRDRSSLRGPFRPHGIHSCSAVR